MKYIFIVNESAGKGKYKKIVPNIEQVCKNRKIDYEIRYIEKDKTGYDIALEYKDEECVIYVVGGDGSLAITLPALIGTKNSLGIIPAGSGNDTYRTVKTKAGAEMGYISFSDQSGVMEGIIFPKTYYRLRVLLVKGSMVFVRGRVQHDDSRGTKLLVQELRVPSKEELSEKIKRLYLKIPSQSSLEMQRVLDVLQKHPGAQEWQTLR